MVAKLKPFTCLHPSCSIISGGKTLDANALLKMALNSVSRPPIPMFEKSQSGFMMEVWAILPFDFPESWREDPSAFSKIIVVFGRLMPTWIKRVDFYKPFELLKINQQCPTWAFWGFDSLPLLMAFKSVTSMSLIAIKVNGKLLNWKTMGWPMVNT